MNGCEDAIASHRRESSRAMRRENLPIILWSLFAMSMPLVAGGAALLLAG
jgi:hypothetical protein